MERVLGELIPHTAEERLQRHGDQDQPVQFPEPPTDRHNLDVAAYAKGREGIDKPALLTGRDVPIDEDLGHQLFGVTHRSPL